MDVYHKRDTCRVCNNQNMELILDLGEQPPANSFLSSEHLNSTELRFPLRLFVCRNCFLVQLLDIVDKEFLFKHYLYISSANKPLLEHFFNYAQYISQNFVSNKENSLIMEIGSNDGMLLREFIKLGISVLGIEPASNIAKMANESGVPTLNEFFTSALAQSLREKRPTAIIANNVVGHIDDLHDFVKGISILLQDRSIFVFEVPYLVDMIDKLEYDTIYHEHRSYFSIMPLSRILEEYDLQIFDIQKQKVHGGTVRVFVSRRGEREVNEIVTTILNQEKEHRINDVRTYQQFGKNVELSREMLLRELSKLKEDGKKIFGYGAPAKGNVLLNYCGIDTRLLEFVTDTTPLKQGMYTPGTRIPIRSPEVINNMNGEYIALLLAWNYEEAILSKESEFRKRGGRFLIPIPYARLK